MKRVAAAAMVALALGGLVTTSFAQTVQTEAMNHPRIVAAIREMEEAIRYMEAAPHDFGGHKADAIRDTRAAIAQLRKALAYRARMDR